MATTRIPPHIVTEIEESAAKDWPDDYEMQMEVIESETKYCAEFFNLDFGEALPFKSMILKECSEIFDSWEYRLSAAKAELEAFVELQNLFYPDIPLEVLEEVRAKVNFEDGDFSFQLKEIQSGIQAYRKVREIRGKIEPYREVLVAMESILSSECYNSNTQNFGPGGVWEGEGRTYRYPVHFLVQGSDERRKGKTDDLPAEALITGRYQFGANQVNVYRALVRIIEMLQRDHGLTLDSSQNLKTDT